MTTFTVIMVFIGAFIVGAWIGLEWSNRRVLRKIEIMRLESRIADLERRP